MFSASFILALCTTAVVWAAASASSSSSLSAKERAKEVLAQMNLEEMISMLHGTLTLTESYIGYVSGIPRLGIPSLNMNDGPQGFRCESFPGTSTAFPGGLTIGSTFDRDAAEIWGKAMGEEFAGKGANIQLGPGLNIARIPNGGRNFEYMSGGDPMLGYEMVQNAIEAIQSQGVIANAKHWIENNQEENRMTVSEVVDERPRHEFYYKPFEGAIKAGVGSFMCSYNKINSVWSCENPETLNTDLKGRLGFEGFVMSDWGATHSTSINEGLDQEMPVGLHFSGHVLRSMVENGTITREKIEDSVTRMLVPMFQMGLFDRPEPDKDAFANDVTSEAHTRVARDLAARAQMLLKNDGDVLPIRALDFGNPFKIALIGQAARAPVIAGGGSGAVFPSKVTAPYEGFLLALGIPLDQVPPVEVNCSVSSSRRVRYAQIGCLHVPATDVDDCMSQCAAYSSCNFWTFQERVCSFFPTEGFKQEGGGDSGLLSTSGTCQRTYPAPEWHCNGRNQCLAVVTGEDLEVASQLAAEADVAIVTMATTACEGNDRADISFDLNTDSSLCQVAQVGANNLVSVVAGSKTPTVVAGVAPGAVLMPWKEAVDAVVLSFMPGQEYGNALADVIFGKVNPSARLPLTIPNMENEMGLSPAQYPGIDKVAEYTEGMYVDYRWYVANSVQPAYPFGHGLSYTAFSYGAVEIKQEGVSRDGEVSVEVKNEGKIAGAEVVQMYVTYPPAANAPQRQLKGFQKTAVLQGGASETVVMPLRKQDLRTWDPELHEWSLWPGTYTVSIGASSEDIRLTSQFQV